MKASKIVFPVENILSINFFSQQGIKTLKISSAFFGFNSPVECSCQKRKMMMSFASETYLPSFFSSLCFILLILHELPSGLPRGGQFFGLTLHVIEPWHQERLPSPFLIESVYNRFQKLRPINGVLGLV